MRSLVDQYRPKLQLAQPRVSRAHASATDHISSSKDLLFAVANQGLVLSLVGLTQLSLLVLELDKFLQLDMAGVVGNLAVEAEKRDGRVRFLAGFGGKANDLEAGEVDLLRELIDGDVGGGANEHLASVHLGEVIDDGSGSDRLSGPGGSLNKTDGFLQDALDGVHLRVVQFWEIGCREPASCQ